MRSLLTLVIVALVAVFVLGNTLFIVSEPEQVIITRFGEPVHDPITEPGIKARVPFIDTINRFDKRWIAWDGFPNQIPTKDKKYISVDCYARWRIVDPLRFFQAVRDEESAQSRLDDIIDGQTRDVIASYDLIEVVRATDRGFEVSEEVADLIPSEIVSNIEAGRGSLAQEILERAAQITPDYGIELVDVRFKRLNYIDTVRERVYERMISERQRIAEQFRSEGQGKSAEIRGQMQRDIRQIRSEAYKTAQEIRGEGDAESTRTYAEAYRSDPELYGFLRTLEAWEKSLGKDTSLVLTTDAEFLTYLKRAK
jgi:membrane protease subunit HflC